MQRRREFKKKLIISKYLNISQKTSFGNNYDRQAVAKHKYYNKKQINKCS